MTRHGHIRIIREKDGSLSIGTGHYENDRLDETTGEVAIKSRAGDLDSLYDRVRRETDEAFKADIVDRV